MFVQTQLGLDLEKGVARSIWDAVKKKDMKNGRVLGLTEPGGGSSGERWEERDNGKENGERADLVELNQQLADPSAGGGRKNLRRVTKETPTTCPSRKDGGQGTEQPKRTNVRERAEGHTIGRQQK